MNKLIKSLMLLVAMTITFTGCHQESPEVIDPVNDALYKPSKYEVSTEDGTPTKVSIVYFGRLNPLGGFNTPDLQPYTIETTTPWEYAMMTCKDFTYTLVIRNIDTVDVNIVAKVVIDDYTVAEQTGEWIDLMYEY